MNNIAEFLSHFKRVRKTGPSSWMVECPAHDDSTPSLRISIDKNRILINCKAGCMPEAVVAAVGLKMSDLFIDNGNQGDNGLRGIELFASIRGHKTAAYRSLGCVEKNGEIQFPMRDASGQVTGWRRRRANGSKIGGRKALCKKGDKNGLIFDTEAVHGAKTFLVTEGEIDAAAAMSAGCQLAAIATPGSTPGRATFQHLAKICQGAEVTLATDPGEPGKNWENAVAAALIKAGCKVQVITPTDGDLDERLNSGESLDAILATAQPYDKRAITSPQNAQAGGRPKVSYREIADSFVQSQRGPDGVLRLRFHQGQWRKFDGQCFRAINFDDLKAAVMKHLRREFPTNENRNTVMNVVANLQSFDTCALPSWQRIPAWLGAGEDDHGDAAGWMPMQNGAVDIERLAAGGDPSSSEVFRPLTAKLFTPFALEYEFDPAADCPQWLRYLEGVQPDPADRTVLQKMAGLALVPDTSYNVAFVLYGQGGTGKSVSLHVLQQLVGPANCCCLPLAQFDSRFATWQLTARLLNVVGDLPTSDEDTTMRHVEGIFKDVCSGGLIPVEHKHQELSNAPAIARNIFATNSLPHFSDKSNAVWDRLRIMPFERVFRGTAGEVRDLGEIIAAKELPGVFNWAVAGLGKLRADTRFPEHSRGEAIKEHHRKLCDPELVFLRENYNASDNPNQWIETKTAYSEFREWMVMNGFKRRSEFTFAEAVHRVFNRRKERVRVKNCGQMVVYRGLEKRFDFIESEQNEESF